ncbi:MAG: hypothetical protein U5N27_22510 [Rhizobium sp.]|nr:hypothetical protein [Rhizobium sp.]
MWISDCRVVLLDRVLPNGAVRIEDGMIAEISEDPGGRGRYHRRKA